MGTSTSTIDALSIVNGDVSATAAIGRAKLAAESKKFTQPLESLRIFDDTANAVLPNTAATDDLGMVLGVRPFAASGNGHSVQTSDAKATTVTQKAAFTFNLPAEYKSAGTITLQPYAGMLTTISDGTATIDFEVWWKNPADRLLGATDLCTTAATTINSLTLGAKSFTITPTSRVNGDELAVLMTVAITDAATGTAVLGLITQIHWLLEVQG